MANKIQVTINNWDKYNGRKDIKAASWFRLSNGIFEDPDFFEFSREELLVWIYILSLASKKQLPDIELSLAHATRVAGFDSTTVESSLHLLARISAITTPERQANTPNPPENTPADADVTRTLRGRTDKITPPNVGVTLQDKTNITNKTKNLVRSEPDEHASVVSDEGLMPGLDPMDHEFTFQEVATSGPITDSDRKNELAANKALVRGQPAIREELERVYQELYPRKEKKTEGITRAMRQIKTLEQVAEFRQATTRFRDHHRTKGTEPQYLPIFSSYVGRTGVEWRDWLDPQTGQAENFKKVEPFAIPDSEKPWMKEGVY